MDHLRVAAWNLERKKPTTPTGSKGVEHVHGLGADVVVLTESRTSFPIDGGHLVWSGDWGGGEERKVVMWSREPWTDVDDVGSKNLPAARFVAATTTTPIGPIRVLGVCISWHMANVQYGARNKKPWQDHISYCNALMDVIAAHLAERTLPLVVAGDYNQRWPRVRPNGKAGEALRRVLADVALLTGGDVEGQDSLGIDHIAVDGLAPQRVWGWPNVIDGVRCSDHAGVAADLTLATLR